MSPLYVRLCNSLEEYLDDLAKVTVNVNIDNKTEKLNFAEAALLIQGSSAVYARKVEYLHSLVYKTLEALTEKKNKKSKVRLKVMVLDVESGVEFLHARFSQNHNIHTQQTTQHTLHNATYANFNLIGWQLCRC